MRKTAFFFSRLSRNAVLAAAGLGFAAAAAFAAGTMFDPATGSSYDCELNQLGIQGCANVQVLEKSGVDFIKPHPDTSVWGAIAFAANTDWGTFVKAKTKQAAEAGAMAACHGVRGQSCKVVLDIPGYCGALAINNEDKKWGVSGISGAMDVANKDALFHCIEKGCGIATTICADGGKYYYQVPKTK